MAQTAEIKELIVAAAQGAASGLEEMKKLSVGVELAEFEIETTYESVTEITPSQGATKQLPRLRFTIYPARIGQRRNVRYGLTVRLMFLPKKTEAT